MPAAAATTRIGYSCSLGSEMRRTPQRRPRPPTTPTARPMVICRANSTSAVSPAENPPPVAPRMLTSRAMPTGSFAPDSPSRMVPLRPATSRPLSTENTTAGSVGASAVPSSRAVRQSRPKIPRAATASPAAVTTVPITPIHNTGPSEGRRRRQPRFMPPSKRMTTSPTVTIRPFISGLNRPSAGQTSEASAAPTRNSAGAGTRMTRLIRLPTRAARTARLTSRMAAPNRIESSTLTAAPPVRRDEPARRTQHSSVAGGGRAVGGRRVDPVGVPRHRLPGLRRTGLQAVGGQQVADAVGAAADVRGDQVDVGGHAPRAVGRPPDVGALARRLRQQVRRGQLDRAADQPEAAAADRQPAGRRPLGPAVGQAEPAVVGGGRVSAENGGEPLSHVLGQMTHRGSVVPQRRLVVLREVVHRPGDRAPLHERVRGRPVRRGDVGPAHVDVLIAAVADGGVEDAGVGLEHRRDQGGDRRLGGVPPGGGGPGGGGEGGSGGGGGGGHGRETTPRTG